MSRLVTSDGVDFELRGPRDGDADLPTRLLGQIAVTPATMALPLVGVLLAWLQGQPVPNPLGVLATMVACGVFGSLAGVALTEAWWAAGKPRALSIRSWGLLLDGERLPWDAIEAVGESKHSFSVVSRTGRHWSFFQPEYDAGAEVAEAVRRGQALSDQTVSLAQQDAMHALTRG